MENKEDPVLDPEENEEQSSRRLQDTFYYEDSHQEKQLRDSAVPQALGKYHWCAGFDSLKKNNLHVLAEDKILFAIGSTYHVYDINTREDKIFFSKDGKNALNYPHFRSYQCCKLCRKSFSLCLRR